MAKRETHGRHTEPRTRGLRRMGGLRGYARKRVRHLVTHPSGCGKDKTMRPHVKKSTSFRHVNISPSLRLQLVTEVPVGI